MNFLFLESSRAWGGQEYRTCLEVNWLNAHGHAAWFGCDANGDVFAKAQTLGTRLLPLNLRQRCNPLVSFQLWRFCRQHHVEIIKSYSSKDHWLALPLFWLGIPLTRSRCITDRVDGGRRAFIFRHGCSRIVADAAVIKRQLVADKVVPAEKVVVIGSAVDLETFRPDRDRLKFRRELDLGEEERLILNVGMIRPDKGQVKLVEAAALVLREYPRARFAFAGEGTGVKKLGPKVRDAIERAGIGDRVAMLGYRWDIPEILAAADVVVIASTSVEASPIVLRETLATGRPLVVTRVGDVAETIRDREQGLLVEPSSPADLARAILEFLRDPELAQRCATNGLAYAREHFSFDRMMQEKLRVDEEIVATALRRKR